MTDIRAAHLDRLDTLTDEPVPRRRLISTVACSRAVRVGAVAAAATGLLVVLAISRPASAEPSTQAPASQPRHDLTTWIAAGPGPARHPADPRPPSTDRPGRDETGRTPAAPSTP